MYLSIKKWGYAEKSVGCAFPFRGSFKSQENESGVFQSVCGKCGEIRTESNDGTGPVADEGITGQNNPGQNGSG